MFQLRGEGGGGERRAGAYRVFVAGTKKGRELEEGVVGRGTCFFFKKTLRTKSILNQF